MPRVDRTDIGGYVYHVLNRANARVQIFDNDKDYKQFEDILEEAIEKYDMRLLSYCIMSNHWHLILYPKKDGDLALFMGWLSNTHTKRWHATKKTIGQGHLYQGRYKSFLCQKDNYFLSLVRYVERNAKKANLVKRAENWRWSSVWRREKGTLKEKKLLSSWLVSKPENYLVWLNSTQAQEEEKAIQRSIMRGNPFGESKWVQQMIIKHKLETTIRPIGRPKKGEKKGG